MAKKQNIESASVFERSGVRSIRVRVIEVLLYFVSACPNPPGVSFDNMDLITPIEGETFTGGDILMFECSLSNYSASGCNYAECLANGSWAIYDNGGCSPSRYHTHTHTHTHTHSF